MHTFTVWAPEAGSVDLVTRSGTRPMTGSPGGWWSLAVAEAGPGTDYRFRVDGGPPVPDPRSAWQPAGVHGPSRVFDPQEYAWQDGDWPGRDARGALFYELHIGTFTPEGTLDAAAARLDHLVDLGVEMVELMPVAAFPGEWGWGYDGVALYAVHERYGGPAALQRFVDACHQKGLGVCLDVVYNHLGPDGNYLHGFGPYFTDEHHTPWGQAVNLDQPGSDPVRRFICDNALRWFADFHIDALRLDAVHALADDSRPHLLAQLSDETAELCAALGRPLSLIAESDLNDPVMVTPTDQGGLGMTAQWNDDFHHALRALLTGERDGYYVDFGEPATLAHALTDVFVHNGGWSTFRQQDWGAPVDRATQDGHAFLAYTTTHDQTGNRAAGDRLNHQLSPGRSAIAAALTLTSPFTPMLFMGEEWAASTPWCYFTDHEDPELGQAVREGRRREFASHGWDADDIPDPQDHATRDSSVLHWDEIGRPDHRRMLSWYRGLAALRRREPDLASGSLQDIRVDLDSDGDWLVVARGGLRIVVNLSGRQRKVPLDAPALLTLAAWNGALLSTRAVRLPAESVAVVRVDPTPTVRDAVTRYLTGIAEDARDAVRRADVHDMRVSCRRTRSVLRAHSCVWRKSDRTRSDDLADRARWVARHLSDARDGEVVGEVVQDWAGQDGWDPARTSSVLDALYPARLATRTTAPKAAVPHQENEHAAIVAEQSQVLLELADEVETFLRTARWRGVAADPADSGLAAYRLRAAERVRLRATAAADVDPIEDPDALWHLVRKAAKRVRYTAEVGVKAGEDRAADVVSAAKNVQTVIGDLQDAALVATRLREVLAASTGQRSVALASVLERAGQTIDDRKRALPQALDGLWQAIPGFAVRPAITVVPHRVSEEI